MTNDMIDDSQIVNDSSLKQFPTLKNLLQESWEVFKAKIKPLVILSVIQSFAYAGIFAVIFATSLAMIVPFGAIDLTAGTNVLDLLYNIGWQVWFGLFAMFLALITMGIFFQSASILIIDRTISIQDSLRTAFKYLLTLLSSTLIVLFIVLGGLFLLLIPGIILAFYLMFTPFEIILENKKALEAIKTSVALVKSNAKEVLLKMVIWMVIIMLVSAGLDKLLSDPNEPSILYQFAMYLIGLFNTIFLYKLYKTVKNTAGNVAPSSLKGIVAVSLLGWLIVAFSGMSIIRVLQSVDLSEFYSSFDTLPEYSGTIPTTSDELR